MRVPQACIGQVSGKYRATQFRASIGQVSNSFSVVFSFILSREPGRALSQSGVTFIILFHHSHVTFIILVRVFIRCIARKKLNNRSSITQTIHRHRANHTSLMATQHRALTAAQTTTAIRNLRVNLLNNNITIIITYTSTQS